MLEHVAAIALRVYQEKCFLYRDQKIAQEPDYAETVQRVSSALESVSDKWVKPPALFMPAQEKWTAQPQTDQKTDPIQHIEIAKRILHEMVEIETRGLVYEGSSNDYKRGVYDTLVKVHIHVIDRLSPMLFVK